MKYETINYKIGNVLTIGEKFEKNVSKVHFTGFQMLDETHELYFCMDGMLIPMVDYTLDVIEPLMRKEGVFDAQLIELGDEQENRSRVFRVKVASSIDMGEAVEVEDGRLETIYQKYNDLYQQLIHDRDTGVFKGDPGEPGHTPIKGVDYNDGYTPQKGIDYFDGKDGKDYVITEADYEAIAERTKDLVPPYDDTAINKRVDDVNDSLTELSTEVDGKVGFEDYATSSKGGVVKIESWLGHQISSNGALRGSIYNNAQYATRADETFICKGTLENVLAERLKDLKEDIAENKRIDDARWKMAQGIVWDFAEDTAEAYSKDIPTGAKAMDVQSIGGKSVVWNQLVKYDAPSTANTINNGDGSFTLIGDEYYRLNNNFNGSVGHKYYFNVVGGISGKAYLRIDDLDGNAITTEINTIVTISNETRPSLMIRSYGLTKNITIKPRLFDLTAMFGTGNEPTDVNDPRIKFIESYASTHPEYNAGQIVSADVTDVVVRGKNLFDPSTMQASKTESGVTWTNNGDGTVTVNGVANNYTSFTIANNLPIKFDEAMYTLSISGGTNVVIGDVILKDEFGFQVEKFSVGNIQKTLDMSIYRNTRSITIAIKRNTNNTVSGTIRIKIEKGTTATAYTPYIDPTTIIIPEAIRNLDGYGWSAGSVCNEVDYANKKYIKRVGVVDMGSLIWGYVGGTYSRLTANISNLAINPVTSTIGNIICENYIAASVNTVYAHNADKIIGVHNKLTEIWIYDSDYSDATAFKQAMQGVMLYYELAEPIVTDISDLIGDEFENIEVEANGSITFEQSDTELAIPNKEEYLIALKEVV